MLILLKYFTLGLILVLVEAQTPSAEPGLTNGNNPASSYSDFPGSLSNQNQPKPQNGPSQAGPSNAGPITIPSASNGYSAFPNTFGLPETPGAQGNHNVRPTNPSVEASSGRQGIPVSAVAASELSQGLIKPKSPLSTGTDSWTPMGHLGTGKQPWGPVQPGANQPAPQQPAPNTLPYDVSQSQVPIGQQIMQQQQQQQQQYDMFGFPINNAPDPFANMFGMGPSTDLFAPMSPSPDPFFGMFGGATGASGGGLFEGSSRGGRGSSTGGHGPGGDFLQMMLMMQLIGGGDAPDPPANPTRGRGRGRGRGASANSTPASAIEQLIRLEEIRAMRNRQRERVNRNRRVQQNQRGGNARQGPYPPRGYRPAGSIPRPPPTRTMSTAFQPRYQQNAGTNRQPAPARNSLHPEVLDRRNMPATPAPTQPGQEPVEREGGARAQRAVQEQTQQNAQGQGFDRQRVSSAIVQRPSLTVGQNVGYPNFNVYESSVQGQNQPQSLAQGQQLTQNPAQYQPSGHMQGQNQPHLSNQMQLGSPSNRQQFPGGPNAVPRNIQQLINNPRFQRRLRVAGSTPGANPADVRADQADLMADRADNLQAMNPLLRMMQFGMPGMQGRPGQSPMGQSPLASLFGGSGSPSGLSALRMMGGGMGI